MWKWKRFTAMRAVFVVTAIAWLPAGWALGLTPVEVAYQNGLDGYTGTFDRVIDERGGTNEVDGSTVVQYAVDGFAPGDAPSPDRQGLIRFDNIIGNGPGQIPSNAFIIDAELQVTTTWGGNAQTNGPWGVAGLLEPFDSSTVYANFPAFRGPWYQDGTATRAVGSFGASQQGDVARANVRSLVQSWADGTLTNNGMAVQAGFTGTSDGWNIYTTGHGIGADYDFPTYRPKLNVSYTTSPVEVNTFQRGLDGYTGDTMALVNGGANLLGANPASDDVTTDGLTLGQAFLDGTDFITSVPNPSPDIISLVKFDNVFGTGEGQAPADMAVLKAWLVVTTGDLSDAARTPGGISVHRMLSDWDTSTLHSDLDVGLVPEDGMRRGDDISAALDQQRGAITGSEVWLDVTSYLEGVRNGADDFGLAVVLDSPDGIQFHFNGSEDASARPRLVVASAESGLSVGLPGDYNGDGMVDAADYTVWKDNYGGNFNLNGNGNETGASAGVVDDDDYFWWVDHFGDTSDGGSSNQAAVPEPSTWALGLLLVGALAGYTARKK